MIVQDYPRNRPCSCLAKDPDWKERYRKQEEEKRRAEAEKKVQQDREAKRKARPMPAFCLAAWSLH